MTNLAKEQQAYNLSQGLPDYDIAPQFHDLLRDAVLLGYNQYAPMAGMYELREQIAVDVNHRYDTDYCNGQNITITPGATYAIYAALNALINKGDEVIYIEPAFDCYRPAIEMNGGLPVCVKLNAANNFAIDWQQIQDAITIRTKAIIINTPHNPTGLVWKQSDWKMLSAILDGRDIFVISDEVYDSIVFDGIKHTPGFLQKGIQEKLISIYSFGKAFHITGWKIGYCIAAPHITEAFRSVHQYLSFCVNSPAQYALAKYLGIYMAGEAARLLEEKRNLLLSGMQKSRFSTNNICCGTYFQLFDYSSISTLNDIEFAKWLTVEHKVATIPLSAFYKMPPGVKMIRLCFAKKDEVIQKATEVLSKL